MRISTNPSPGSILPITLISSGTIRAREIMVRCMEPSPSLMELWHYLVGTYDGSSIQFVRRRIPGRITSAVAGFKHTFSPLSRWAAARALILQLPLQRGHGIEVRYSKTNRSADWTLIISTS